MYRFIIDSGMKIVLGILIIRNYMCYGDVFDLVDLFYGSSLTYGIQKFSMKLVVLSGHAVDIGILFQYQIIGFSMWNYFTHFFLPSFKLSGPYSNIYVSVLLSIGFVLRGSFYSDFMTLTHYFLLLLSTSYFFHPYCYYSHIDGYQRIISVEYLSLSIHICVQFSKPRNCYLQLVVIGSEATKDLLLMSFFNHRTSIIFFLLSSFSSLSSV